MACCTVVIFSASSSGISHSNSSSRAITSSTLSSESAPRSSTKEDSVLMSASATPSCSATIFLTRASTFSIEILQELYWVWVLRKRLQLYRFPASFHVHPAVHVQRGAGDVARVLRAEEEHGLRHVLDASQAPERYVLEHFLRRVLAQRARHVGVDEAGRDTVHRDAAAADFPR